MALRDEHIMWPDANKRVEIVKRIKKEFQWPNCVGLKDGLLSELAITPRCKDKADYNSRNMNTPSPCY